MCFCPFAVPTVLSYKQTIKACNYCGDYYTTHYLFQFYTLIRSLRVLNCTLASLKKYPMSALPTDFPINDLSWDIFTADNSFNICTYEGRCV